MAIMARTPKDRKPDGGAKRTARGFQRAATTTRDQIERVAGKNGFAEADVLLRWAEIVGADHSAKCRPVKVSYRHRSHGATLVVQTDSARAPEIEHQKAHIIERVNRFYGYGAIRHLKVTQSTGQRGAMGFAEGASAFIGPVADAAMAEPTKADTTEAALMTKDIADDGLREALARMASNVLAYGRARRNQTNDISEEKDRT